MLALRLLRLLVGRLGGEFAPSVCHEHHDKFLHLGEGRERTYDFGLECSLPDIIVFDHPVCILSLSNALVSRALALPLFQSSLISFWQWMYRVFPSITRSIDSYSRADSSCEINIFRDWVSLTICEFSNHHELLCATDLNLIVITCIKYVL